MIKIKNRQDCVGCRGCEQRCPVQCISMESDEQDFVYPRVDVERCIDCHLCEKVCPVINVAEPRKPTEVLAAYNNAAQVRRESSSGGVFYNLAKKTLGEGGVVFGARFDDDFNVVHDCVEKIDDLGELLRSKYVQSDIGDSYKRTEAFLKSGRRVLFSGTPCQIAGLRLYLRKDYGDRLTCVEVACHGVPSPGVWRKYLERRGRHVEAVNFRDKRAGWDPYGISVKADGKERFDLFYHDLYMSAFVRNLTLRPSCFACPARSGRSGADVTLADYWGIEKVMPDIDKRNGVSLVLTYGRPLDRTGLTCRESTYDDAVKMNRSLVQDSKVPVGYDDFWASYPKFGIKYLQKYLDITRGLTLFDKAKRLVKKMIGRK